ncbi:MAG: hypothetical protein LCH92_01585 [Proteobacteria bacterium]|nr:hypothetical protein [Pseudomonadota bacterium]
MTINQSVIDELGFAKGQPPMTGGQFRKRVEAFLRREWHPLMREIDPAGFETWRASMLPTVAEAEANFAFNWQLQAYREATARLARYRLAEGRAEIVEEHEDETIILAPAVPPLPAEIEVTTYDETGAATGVETLPNPAILADDAERAAAQAVIDATPQAVVDFAAGLEG